MNKTTAKSAAGRRYVSLILGKADHQFLVDGFVPASSEAGGFAEFLTVLEDFRIGSSAKLKAFPGKHCVVTRKDSVQNAMAALVGADKPGHHQ
jgi:hypothetical protein